MPLIIAADQTRRVPRRDCCDVRERILTGELFWGGGALYLFGASWPVADFADNALKGRSHFLCLCFPCSAKGKRSIMGRSAFSRNCNRWTHNSKSKDSVGEWRMILRQGTVLFLVGKKPWCYVFTNENKPTCVDHKFAHQCRHVSIKLFNPLKLGWQNGTTQSIQHCRRRTFNWCSI